MVPRVLALLLSLLWLLVLLPARARARAAHCAGGRRYSLGIMYPAFMSFKSVDRGDEAAASYWLTYWIVWSFITMVEVFEAIGEMIPFYYELKLALVIWLIHPQSKVRGSRSAPRGSRFAPRRPGSAVPLRRSVALRCGAPALLSAVALCRLAAAAALALRRSGSDATPAALRQGAEVCFKHLVQPLLKKHEKSIDDGLTHVQVRAGDGFNMLKQRAEAAGFEFPSWEGEGGGGSGGSFAGGAGADGMRQRGGAGGPGGAAAADPLDPEAGDAAPTTPPGSAAKADD